MGSRDPIDLTAYRKDGRLYVRMSGSLTMLNFEGALREFHRLLDDSPESLYIMMRDIDYLDSAGLGMFVRLNTRCRTARIRMILLDPSPAVTRLFNLSKMDLIMPIERGAEAQGIRDEMERDANSVDFDSPE